jgi:hypothetical protein
MRLEGVDRMQKREVWRRQEQELVERWSAAMERYRVAHEQLSARQQAQGRCAPDDEFGGSPASRKSPRAVGLPCAARSWNAP